MADGARVDALALECRTFTQYLVGADPAADVVAAYHRAHVVTAVAPAGASSRPLDRALLRVARLGPVCTRAADSYAAAFARSTVLRRKLVLLVAILESRGETASTIDSADPGGRAAWMFRVGAQITASALMLALAALVIIPLRLWYRVSNAGGA
jgi:hypothetical protein